MMMYLASNILPEIDFLVHQCTRFTHYVKYSHKNYALDICKYLNITQKEGLILRPNKNLNMECYIDNDFMICMALKSLKIQFLSSQVPDM